MKRITLLIILGILCHFENKAQISFSKEYGGAYNEDGRWMEQMPDSGFILTGGTTTFSNGQTDIWLVRTDAYGNTMWQKSIGGTAFDFANMVKPVPGGFVICGVTNRTGSDDAIILKTDNNGVTQWTTVLGDAAIQWFEGFIPTTDGGYTAVGVNTGAGTHGTYDIYLVKFNSAGVMQWEKNIGGQSYEIGNSVQQTADGGYIISGQTYSYGNLDGDYYLVKTDASGNVQWEKTYGRPDLQECHYAQVTPDGGYIMIGDADDLPNGLGDTDAWMIKTDSVGNIVWEKVFGGTKKDGGKTVENTSDGGYIVAGITRSFGLVNPNYFLIKTDYYGNLVWQQTNYGTSHHDHAYRAIETSDYGFAEFGFFRNSGGFQNFGLVKLPGNAAITKDLSVDDITAPAPFVCRSADVPLSVLLTNYGSTLEQNIIVTLQISNGVQSTTLVDTLPSALVPGNSATLNFTPTYNFTVDSVYTLKAFIQHRNSDISYTNDTNIVYITVIPPTSDPVGASAISCNSGSATLTATRAASADSLFWYDAAVNGNLIGAGASYTTPSISNTTTYYVKAEKGKGSKVGPLDNSIGAGSSNSSGYLKFDSRTYFKLISVLVYPQTSGSRTIQLRNSAGTVLQSKTINLPVAAGGIRVYLDFDVPQGNDLQLGLSGSSGSLFRNTAGAVLPYSVSQTLEINGTSGNAGTWYYFYDWYVFVPSENCESNRIPVQAIVGSGTTTAFDVNRCGNGSVTLFANSSSSVSWYSAASGGSLLSNNNSYTTPSLNSTTTYYLDINNCSSRIAVDAIINSVSSQPTAPDVTHCGPGTVTLTATSPDPVSWYSAATNGVLYHTGSSFTTPFLNSSVTYYAIAGTLCPSTPNAVVAIISGAVAPVGTGATACGPASVTISATSSDPITWYSVPTGGSPISVNHSSYTTPVISSPVTYYAEAGTSCPSPRVAVVANVFTVDPPVGTGASHCGSGSVVLSAQSVNNISWWTSASGGSQLNTGQIFTTPTINSTTTYYAMATSGACNSTRTGVVATIQNTTAPTPTAGSRCGTGTVTLTATASDSIFWYSAASGGSPLGTGGSFTTPSISVTTTYYVQAGNSCPSSRVPVVASVVSSASSPAAIDSSRCGTGTVTLSATSSNPLTWYDSPGGSVLGTGATYTTPSISSSTTYYVRAGAAGCFSSYVPVVATINPAPSTPVVSSAENCGPAQLTLSATSSDSLTWFDQATGGNVLTTGLSYTSTFNSTTTVYVQATKGQCSTGRIPVTASIYSNPFVNLGPPVITVNQGQIVVLDAGPGFSSYHWSNNATTRTINVSNDGIFWVDVADAHGCHGSDTITVDVIYLGISDPSLNSALEIYPNPTQGMLNVRMNNSSLRFNLEIIDITGRVIVKDSHKANAIFNKTYDLSELAKGVYYLRILSSDGTATRSLIIQ